MVDFGGTQNVHFWPFLATMKKKMDMYTQVKIFIDICIYAPYMSRVNVDTLNCY